LLNYPRKPGGAVITEEMPHPDGARLVTGRHVDACALTLLWQRQAGLQAQTPDGRWLDIACRPGAISVHLGSVMEFLTAGHWRATPHRVLDNGMARGAIGYFHEPNLDAELALQISPKIAPPPEQSRQTARLTYGAHLLQRFSRYGGLEHLRARACQVRLRSPDTL
ncbi:MAG TPA: 2OG-Fe(II) oxygenase family protein, partial [Alphaproteobacteria bacterium]|nr:2OG-Fe(II) oxygenase family protein [Alphaproteobacteria bacterium]